LEDSKKMKVSKVLALAIIIVFICNLVGFASPLQVSNLIPGNVYIPKGTLIKTEIITPINSGKNKVNDIVMFKTTEAIVINGVEVIPKGTVGEAIVTKVSPAGSWGKGGKIEIAAKSLKTLNGIEIPLTLDAQKSGGGANMVLGVLALGIFSGFLSGSNQDIPTGTKFQVAVESDTDLQVTNENLAEVMNKSNVVKVTNQSEGTQSPTVVSPLKPLTPELVTPVMSKDVITTALPLPTHKLLYLIAPKDEAAGEKYKEWPIKWSGYYLQRFDEVAPMPGVDWIQGNIDKMITDHPSTYLNAVKVDITQWPVLARKKGWIVSTLASEAKVGAIAIKINLDDATAALFIVKEVFDGGMVVEFIDKNDNIVFAKVTYQAMRDNENGYTFWGYICPIRE
jgi:hypothetical protein